MVTHSRNLARSLVGNHAWTLFLGVQLSRLGVMIFSVFCVFVLINSLMNSILESCIAQLLKFTKNLNIREVNLLS